MSDLKKPRLTPPPLRFALPAVAAGWALAFEAVRFTEQVASNPSANDFRLIYVAARTGVNVGWSHIYDPDRLQNLSQGLGPVVAPITAVYTYNFPPMVAWLAVPLVFFPLAAAFCLWSAVNVASLVVAARLAFAGDVVRWLTVLLVSLALWPAVFSLERGQPELIVFALAIGSWSLASRGRERWAGALLGLTWAIKPQVVLLLPVVLLVCGFRRATAWWLLTAAAAWSLFALVLGATGLGTYLGVLAWEASDPGFASTPLVAPFGPTASLWVGQGLFAAVALAAIWRHRRSLRIAFAIGLAGSLLSAVHLHAYDYVGLVVGAWLVLGAEEVSVLELGWLGVGVICVQLTAIGVGLPILVWQPVWLVLLWIRPVHLMERNAALGVPA